MTVADDIVDRLRKRTVRGAVIWEAPPGTYRADPDELCHEAASEIESLRSLIAEVREAVDQALDDMGESGLSVCLATKREMQAALSRLTREHQSEHSSLSMAIV